MFTGLVKKIGQVVVWTPDHVLQVQTGFSDLALGESIAVDGVCLTVTAIDQTTADFAVSPETCALTCLPQKQPGDGVNLERALTMADRLGGHFVLGHVDNTVRVASITEQQGFHAVHFDGVLPKHRAYVHDKGSVAIHGVSLTVNETTCDGFTVMLIPETMANTTLGDLSVGDLCHVEYDTLVKTVVRHVACQPQSEAV
jgi:riboflavin synthase